MPTLTIKPSGKTQTAVEGTKLIEAVVAAGFPMECTCAKGHYDNCHIFLLEGKKGLAKMTRTESERLDSIVGVGSKSRLACESVFGTEDVTIELLGALSG
jgi:2Fe-2S ferredoxin